MNNNSSTNLAFSDVCSVSGDGIQRNKTEYFEFKLWATFGSLKISFRREVIAGSTHPNVITTWLAEVEIAANMEDLNHSGLCLAIF